jgi:hypothetical protein
MQTTLVTEKGGAVYGCALEGAIAMQTGGGGEFDEMFPEALSIRSSTACRRERYVGDEDVA